jgi:hypothetical protein
MPRSMNGGKLVPVKIIRERFAAGVGVIDR